ncbi:transposase [Embleya sp. NPDC056575]|uniref:transposase n=1 Tax=unclassified Embleya TaxID=2699296 RepID=UPI003683C1F9
MRIMVGPRAVRRGRGGPRPSRAAAEAGRSTGHPRREILNAPSYRLRACCARRLPRHDFPPYRTVHRYGRRWRTEGRSGAIPGALRERERAGRARDPTSGSGIVDSRSVKETERWARAIPAAVP